MNDTSNADLLALIERLGSGDQSARDGLIEHTCERLRRLTRGMLRQFPALRRWEQTDDVLQNALLRLLRALQVCPPESAAHFLHLAARQIRRELLDLARHYQGPLGPGANHESMATPEGSPDEPAAATHDPGALAVWREFHERVEALPDEERAVFDLLWYQGLTQPEAAALLGVSVPTVKRRWMAARLRLQDFVSEEP
jgi:RNA polymerase sigma-70 factor (ECF subfamily)